MCSFVVVVVVAVAVVVVVVDCCCSKLTNLMDAETSSEKTMMLLASKWGLEIPSSSGLGIDGSCFPRQMATTNLVLNGKSQTNTSQSEDVSIHIAPIAVQKLIELPRTTFEGYIYILT